MTRIENITIIGTGLIGGSLALALKQAGFTGMIVGCDRADRLHAAGARGALDASETDATIAVRNSQLTVLAAPVQANLELLSQIAPHVPPGALITDVGSTKAEIAHRAGELFGKDALLRFLGGHPISGRELSGVEHSDAAMFRGAPWVLTPTGGRHALIAPELSRGVHGEFMMLLESIGAVTVVTTPEKHDRVLAFTSHLPQMVSTALAATVEGELGGQKELRDLSGRALREMVRLAKSDPQLWAEVAASNAANLRQALESMERNLAALRQALGTADFVRLFEDARRLDPDADPRPSDDFDPPVFS